MTGPAPQSTPHGSAGATLRAASWVVYDLANTVYAAVLTYVLTPHAKHVLGDLRAFGLVSFASMLLAGLAVPVLGALADRTAAAGRYLTLATLACIVAIAGLGLDAGGGVLLACFFVANVSYNLGLLFYNILLPSVAAPGREGRLSGLGTGVGYVGTLLVLAVVFPLGTPQQQFPGAAAMFLLTALPCLALVHDRRPPQPGSRRQAVVAALGDLRATLGGLRRHRAMAWFLLANFCLLDVINTAILYFADFTRSVFATAAADGSLRWFGTTLRGDDGLLTLVMQLGILLNTAALGCGLVQGRWSDRAPLTVMKASAVALLLALAGGAWFGGRDAHAYAALLGLGGAFGLAGIQTAGRKLVVLLAPPDRVGSYFGLYGITTKLSVVGAVVYGFVEHAAGAPAAMLAQGVPLLLGLAALAMVRVPPPTPASATR